jgi:hypothetical protein
MRTNSPSKISELSNPKILLPAARSGGKELDKYIGGHVKESI